MRFEIAHDTLAQQVYEKVSADVKARQKASLLVKRGLDRYQRRKTLLNKDDLEEIEPHIDSIIFSQEEQNLIQASRRAQTVRRNRFLASALIIMLALAGLSWWALVERDQANHQKTKAEANALAANALLQLKTAKQTNRALSLAAAALNLDSNSLNARQVWFEAIFQASESVFYPPFLTLPISGNISDARFLPETNRILAGTIEKLILYSQDAEVIREFIVDGQRIYDWDISSDGKLLAAALTDQKIRVWDLEDGSLSTTVNYEGKKVVSLSFDPLAGSLLVASEEGLIEMLSLEGQVSLRIDADMENLDWTVLSSDGQFILSVEEEKLLQIWDMNGDLQAKIDQFNYPINTISFDRNAPHFITTAMNDSAAIWDYSGTLIGHVINPGHVVIYSAEYSQNGDFILTANADAKARIYTADGQLLQTFGGHTERLGYAEFNPDEQKILTSSGDGTMKVWDRSSGTLLADLVNRSDLVIRFARFSPDGQRVLSVDEANRLRVWNLDRTNGYSVLPARAAYVQSLSFHPEGTNFSSLSIDGTAYWWSIDGALQAELGSGFSATAWEPAGDYVLQGTEAGMIGLYAATSAQLEKEYDGHFDPITSLEFSQDGRLLLSASLDGLSRLWAFDSSVPKLDSLALLADMPFGISHGIFSPDSHWVLLSDDSHRLHLSALNENVLNGDPVQSSLYETHKDLINTITFSSDSRYFASTSEDQTAAIYSTKDNAFHLVLKHMDPVNDLLFSPNNQFVLTASDDQQIRMWNMSGKLEKAVRAHTLSILDLELSPDGKRLLSAGDDGQVLLYQLDEEAKSIVRIAGFRHDETPVISAKFSPKGDYIVASCIDGRQYIWPLSFAILKKKMNPYLLSNL